MTLHELYEAYKAKKLAFEQAKKEEEKYKGLLKNAMEDAGEKNYTDPEGYLFERIEQSRKKIDEPKLIGELKERGLTSCIKLVEAVDEEATMQAVENGDLPQDVLAECLDVTPVVMMKLTAPKKAKK